MRTRCTCLVAVLLFYLLVRLRRPLTGICGRACPAKVSRLLASGTDRLHGQIESCEVSTEQSAVAAQLPESDKLKNCIRVGVLSAASSNLWLISHDYTPSNRLC